MQLVLFPGDGFVFAWHDDGQDLTGLYGAVSVPLDGGGTFERPAATIVPWAGSLTTDDDGRTPDPRP